MRDVESASLEDTLKCLTQALEESRRLRENLQYLKPTAADLSSPPVQESAEQVEEVLLASV